MVKRLLFVCTGNTCRSPMAKGFFLKLLSEYKENLEFQDYEVLSAGLFTLDGQPATQEAIKAMSLEGIDISNHKSRQIDKELVWWADLILTMTQAHCRQLGDRFPGKKDKIFSIGEFIGESRRDIIDPYGMGQEAYIESSRQLKELLKKVMVEILQGNTEKKLCE